MRVLARPNHLVSSVKGREADEKIAEELYLPALVQVARLLFREEAPTAFDNAGSLLSPVLVR